MGKTKTLTQIPMGTIKKFIDENYRDINFSENALNFFDNAFLGDTDNFQELVGIKDGVPHDVETWLKNEYDIDMKLEGDYAIAAVLCFLLEFEEKATFTEIKDDGITYGGGEHRNCGYFSINNKNKNISMFEIATKNEGFEIFISEEIIPVSILNNKALFKTKVKRENELVVLNLPLVNYKEEVDLSDVFKGSYMVSNKNNLIHEIGSVKTLTLMDLNLDKVEIKQMASMTMMVSGCVAQKVPFKHTIKGDYYIYVRYNNRVLFASKMVKEDFIKNKELEALKFAEIEILEEFQKNKEELKLKMD